MNIFIHVLKIIPLIFPDPWIRKAFGGNIVFIDDMQSSHLLLLGMSVEVSAHQSCIPTPLVASIGGCMNSYKSPSRFNISLKCVLFIIIEQCITIVGGT